MDVTDWVLAFAALATIGLLAMAGIAMIESRVARGVIFTIALGVLFVVEQFIFNFAIPGAQDEFHRQISQCTGGDYYSPGCPGYPPPWQSSP